MAAPNPAALSGLSKGPERYIVEAYAALVLADAVLAAAFSPIRIVDSPTREAFLSYPVYQMSIQPYQVALTDFPSNREKSLTGIVASCYLPDENPGSDSPLLSLDLGNHFRKIAFTRGGALPHPVTAGVWLTFATVTFSMLTPLIPREGVRILSYRTIYETDIVPTTGLFD